MPTQVTGTETTITGLTAGTQYRFRVRARNAVGYGPYSDWSDSGTPTGGGGGGGDPALSLNVTISDVGFTNVTGGVYSYGVGRATASAALAGGTGLLGSLTYNWEGRYLRTLGSWPPGGTPTFIVYDPEDPWTSVSAYSVTTNYLNWSKAYAVGGTNNTPGLIHIRKSWVTPDTLSFPDHFWELRCRVTGTALVDGSSVSLQGVSRTIAFKEMWNGVDFQTIVGGPIL